MRKFGVRTEDVQDATQEALVEAWQGLAEIPAAEHKAREQMLRIVAKVAQRTRRRAARLVCVDELESPDLRDFDAWIATRMLWLEALSRLDEPTRKLLVAYKIDERTYEQIGAEMDEKPRKIRQRVNVAEEKLQQELDKLMGKDNKGKRGAAAMGVGFTLDPFDRAVFRAILDVEEEFGLAPPPVSTVRPKVPAKPWAWQCFPVGLLALALFFVPGQGWRTEALYAEKIGQVSLPSVEVRAAMRASDQARLPLQTSLPRTNAIQVSKESPTLNDNGAAIVKKMGNPLGALKGH